jgi:multimeric flavodoxin WrbA
MKILGINASPRSQKSQTLRLVQAVLDGAKSEGADIELIDACKLDIEYCNACQVCYKTGECVKKDDFQGVYKKILEADGLVIGSPNYLHSITAQMKTLLDRMSDAIHCQLLTGKYTVNVATAGRNHDEVTVYMNSVMLMFGSFVTGSVGASMSQGPGAFDDAQKKAFEIGKALARDVKNKQDYIEQREQLQENREYFMAMVKRNKAAWEHEYEYWNKINWT